MQEERRPVGWKRGGTSKEELRVWTHLLNCGWIACGIVGGAVEVLRAAGILFTAAPTIIGEIGRG